jgi:hypothetical protein
LPKRPEGRRRSLGSTGLMRQPKQENGDVSQYDDFEKQQFLSGMNLLANKSDWPDRINSLFDVWRMLLAVGGDPFLTQGWRESQKALNEEAMKRLRQWREDAIRENVSRSDDAVRIIRQIDDLVCRYGAGELYSFRNIQFECRVAVAEAKLRTADGPWRECLTDALELLREKSIQYNPKTGRQECLTKGTGEDVVAIQNFDAVARDWPALRKRIGALS